MYLELAERNINTRSNYMGARGKKSRVIHQPKYYEVSGYRRSSNYVPAHERRYKALHEGNDETNPYIFIPNFEQGGGVYVREDKFDAMPDNQWKIFFQTIAPYQPEVQQGMSEREFLGNRADRKKRRDERNERKRIKTESKANARETKANAKQTRADAKKTKAENGGGFDWDKAKDTVGGIAGKIFGGGDQTDAGGVAPGSDTETPFYKKPAVIIGGVALLGLGIYFATKKKK